jgi:hypothetical protein
MGDGDFPRLTPRELAAAGHALYGAGWRNALAHALNSTESEIVMVETGCMPAPENWRALVVALAQDMALRALDAASNLLWREADGDAAPPEPARSPTPRYV